MTDDGHHTIDLDEPVFDLLSREKRPGETFNAVLRRLLGLDDEPAKEGEIA